LEKDEVVVPRFEIPAAFTLLVLAQISEAGRDGAATNNKMHGSSWSVTSLIDNCPIWRKLLFVALWEELSSALEHLGYRDNTSHALLVISRQTDPRRLRAFTGLTKQWVNAWRRNLTASRWLRLVYGTGNRTASSVIVDLDIDIYIAIDWSVQPNRDTWQSQHKCTLLSPNPASAIALVRSFCLLERIQHPL
jgi:hypothetical protein